MRPPWRVFACGFGVADDLDPDCARIDRVLVAEAKPAACRHVEADQPGAPEAYRQRPVDGGNVAVLRPLVESLQKLVEPH
jgi:hypothetical protein